MTQEDELWDREERFWTEGADSARSMTMTGAVFILPYPEGILRGDAVWRAGDVAQRWRSVEMSDRVVKIEGDVALLAYRVLAERSNGPVCEALCSSVYILDDGAWLRMTHQQTPVA